MSIGFPVYNGQRYLPEALESLLNQTFTDFELVLVDKASTDGTPEICRAFAARDSRIRYHRNPQNIGGGPNFNLAFALADRAPYFKWAAHDDRHFPGFLAECVSVLDQRPEVVLCHTGVQIIDDDGNVTSPYDPELPHVGDERPSVRFKDLVLGEHWCIDGFGLMRRSVLAKTQLIAGYAGSDRVLLAELGLHGRFFHVPAVLFQSREHAQKSTRTDGLRARGKWFNPKLEGKILLPFWRYLAEYHRSILRVPLPTRERLACLKTLDIEWLYKHNWALRKDLRLAYETLRQRGFGLGPPPTSASFH